MMLVKRIRELERLLGIEPLLLNILPVDGRQRLRCLRRYRKDLERQIKEKEVI